MDHVSRKLTYEYQPPVFLAAQGPDRHDRKEVKSREAKGDEVTLSSSTKASKSSKTRKSSHTKAASHKKETKAADKAERKESAKSHSTLMYIRQDDDMPVTGPHGNCGPDDVCDDGTCGSGHRIDNVDNPDSVIVGDGCSIGVRDGNGSSYSGPDGTYYYDEFH